MAAKKTSRKTTARKPAARKTTARKPAAKKPAKRNYRKKKQDNKLSIGVLFAAIPAIMLAAFIGLRFSGGDRPVQAKPKPAPAKTVTKTVVKKVAVKNVPDEVRLFMFSNGLTPDSLKTSGRRMEISAGSKAKAEKLSGALKNHLENNGISAEGGTTVTAGAYSISFTYKEPAKAVHKQAAKKQSVLPAKHYRAKLAVVIDDCGYSLSLARELAKLDYPITFAVIPYTPYGKQTAVLAKKAGKVLFLHFPMQPRSYPKFDPGKGALLLNMPRKLISVITKADFAYLPVKADGVNNHTGSAFTESSEKMSQALAEIEKYTPAFLDSHTSAKSVAYKECRKTKLKCAQNDIFLDNEEPGLVTITDKENHVHNELMKAARMALRSGSAIAIGHLKKATISALPKTFDEIEKEGVKIVPVTELMH